MSNHMDKKTQNDMAAGNTSGESTEVTTRFEPNSRYSFFLTIGSYYAYLVQL